MNREKMTRSETVCLFLGPKIKFQTTFSLNLVFFKTMEIFTNVQLEIFIFKVIFEKENFAMHFEFSGIELIKIKLIDSNMLG